MRSAHGASQLNYVSGKMRKAIERLHIIFFENTKNSHNSDGSFQSESDFLTRESFGPCLATMQSVRHGDTVNTFLSLRTTSCAMHTANGETRHCRILALLL